MLSGPSRKLYAYEYKSAKFISRYGRFDLSPRIKYAFIGKLMVNEQYYLHE